MESTDVKEKGFDLGEWFEKQPNLLKGGVYLVGFVLVIAAIGAGIESLKPTVQKESTLTISAPAAAPQEQQMGETEPSGLVAQRQAAWAEVQESYSRFTSAGSEFNQQLLESRAQRWWLAANKACADNSDCDSPYAYLLKKYAEYGSELQRITAGGRLRTDASTVSRYYEVQGALAELAHALNTQPGKNPVQTTIPTKTRDDAIDALYRIAGSYDALRIAASQEAYQEAHDETQP